MPPAPQKRHQLAARLSWNREVQIRRSQGGKGSASPCQGARGSAALLRPCGRKLAGCPASGTASLRLAGSATRGGGGKAVSCPAPLTCEDGFELLLERSRQALWQFNC